MNKNSVIGFVLIALILVLFSWYNTKTAVENGVIKKDSILVKSDSCLNSNLTAVLSDTVSASQSTKAEIVYVDSLLTKAGSAKKEVQLLENDKIKIQFTNYGAQPEVVSIKDYFTHDSLELNLLGEGKSKFDIQFNVGENLTTSSFAFSSQRVDDSTLIYSLPFNDSSYIQYIYTLPKGSYLLKLNVKMVGMDKKLPRNLTSIGLSWSLDLPRLEKGYDNEKNYSTVVYKFSNSDGIEHLGFRKDFSEERIPTRFNWFAFQQQFFSAILSSPQTFSNGSLKYTIFPEEDLERRLMKCEANAELPINISSNIDVPLEFYFGPNKYKVLKSYDKGFEKIVPLGGWIIGWINRYIIITVFDFLEKYIVNYGLIILILTLLIKLVISPLTFKSYISSAKMRVLKPELDKINAKYPKSEDAMKKQKEVMDLYSKTGVSMFGGCLPMLLQFPILFAMFRFFPASIELRQESFLWAKDLSTYDSILNLPFNIPLYGDHVSLFSILMAISMYFYSKMNIDQISTGPQMAGMKFMSLYFMPLFLLFLGNNFSSGLTYYYLLSNLITMAQTWLIRKYLVDEEQIHKKLKEKAAQPAKKSKFQERLDNAYKSQQEYLKNKNKR